MGNRHRELKARTAGHVRARPAAVGFNGRAALLVTVRDSVSGFAPHNPEHVFAPFYTMKRTGLGMGLSAFPVLLSNCRTLNRAGNPGGSFV